jgi:uncharacterized phosphosugar-binding protein
MKKELETSMANNIDLYFDTCIQLLQKVSRESRSNIEAGAQAIAGALADGRNFFLFGSGHSALIAREAYWRAGGLAPAMPIPDQMGGDVERISGVAACILAHYDLSPGDVIIVISNSGINPLPVEMALECKARGLTVVSLTSITHSRSIDSRHQSGKKLLDIADIVIDTHGIAGDAALELTGTGLRVGATSTVIGAAIIQAITSRVAEIMLERGLTPPVIVSVNSPGGDDHNREIISQYRNRLIRYEVPTVDAPDKI